MYRQIKYKISQERGFEFVCFVLLLFACLALDSWACTRLKLTLKLNLLRGYNTFILMSLQRSMKNDLKLVNVVKVQ